MTSAASDVEARRSRVRRWVTYAVIYGYLLLAGIVIVWLMWAERYEVAIGVLGGVAGLAGSISGFWFGSRRPEPRAAAELPASEDLSSRPRSYG